MSVRSIIAAAALLAASQAAPAQTLTPLKSQPPGGAGIGFLLTDGTVIFQSGSLTGWIKLTPDNTGSYINGKWTQIAGLPANYATDAFASAVLADGRLVIEGGEYTSGNFTLTNQGAVYDPVQNTWTVQNPPKGWKFIGDSPSLVLPNGTYLIGQKITEKMAVLDPASLTWTAMGSAGKADFNAEEGWTLLPNGQVFTYDVKDAPNSEVYDPVAQKWTSAGNTPVPLNGPPCCKSIKYGKNRVYHPPGEVGPGLLMPNGTVFATGATPLNESHGYTAIWTPSANGGAPGTWTTGPNFPNGDQAGDSFSALLVNGNALVEGVSGELYEFNGTTLVDTKLNGEGGSLFDLPNGQTIVNGSAVYTPSGNPNPAWAPTITQYTSTVTPGTTYTISGTQFNGLSQAASFGDEYQTATNYPLVQVTMTASGHVFYWRTHDHSTMGVATGSAVVSTNFDVPSGAETGAGTLKVVANGIASQGVAVTVQ
jgi:hypothetical protein